MFLNLHASLVWVVITSCLAALLCSNGILTYVPDTHTSRVHFVVLLALQVACTFACALVENVWSKALFSFTRAVFRIEELVLWTCLVLWADTFASLPVGNTVLWTV